MQKRSCIHELYYEIETRDKEISMDPDALPFGLPFLSCRIGVSRTEHTELNVVPVLGQSCHFQVQRLDVTKLWSLMCHNYCQLVSIRESQQELHNPSTQSSKITSQQDRTSIVLKCKNLQKKEIKKKSKTKH